MRNKKTPVIAGSAVCVYSTITFPKYNRGVQAITIERLTSDGNVITKPQDIVKQPTVLEFLGLEEKAKYVDIVFYNRLLRCYVLVDLKIDKLTHQDLADVDVCALLRQI